MIVYSGGEKHELRAVEVLALKALAVGYEPVHRMHGLQLYLLGLCSKSVQGYRITALGERCLKEGGLSANAQNTNGRPEHFIPPG